MTIIPAKMLQPIFSYFKKKKIKAAYKKGRAAARQRLSPSENPYCLFHETKRYNRWVDGWLS